MKNYKSKLLQSTFAISAIFGALSYVNNKPEDSKKVAEEKNEQKVIRKNNEKEAQFLINAAEISFEEITLRQLTQQKGNNSFVKGLGKMMTDEHTKSLANLTALSKTKNI